MSWPSSLTLFFPLTKAGGPRLKRTGLDQDPPPASVMSHFFFLIVHFFPPPFYLAVAERCFHKTPYRVETFPPADSWLNRTGFVPFIARRYPLNAHQFHGTSKLRCRACRPCTSDTGAQPRSLRIFFDLQPPPKMTDDSEKGREFSASHPR